MSARTVEVSIEVDTAAFAAAVDVAVSKLRAVAAAFAAAVDACRPLVTSLLVETAGRFAVESCGVAESDVWRVDPVAGVVKLRNWRRVDLAPFGWPDVPVVTFEPTRRPVPSVRALLPLCSKGWQ